MGRGDKPPLPFSCFTELQRCSSATGCFNELSDFVAVRQDKQFQVVGPAFAGGDLDELSLLMCGMV